MRLLLLAATLLASSSVFAQEGSDLADLIAHPEAQMLSAEKAAEMGLQAHGPVWVVPVEAIDERPPLSYELPASALPNEKDPTLALIIGILVPGGAQLYVEDYSKGLTLLAIGYGSLIGGWFLYHALDVPAIRLLGIAGYLGALIYGALQARDDAEAANRRNGYALAPSMTHTLEGTAAGLTLRASF